MLWPQQDHPTGNPRSTATAQDRKDNSFLDHLAGSEEDAQDAQSGLGNGAVFS